MSQNKLASSHQGKSQDQDGVHRQQAEAVYHILQEEDWHYEEGKAESWISFYIHGFLWTF